MKFVQECFRVCAIPDSMNRTFIVPIPKVNQLANFNQFCLISLCNFAYKIVSKILAIWLRRLMDKIISLFQGTFVKGHWIAENTVVEQELAHKVKKHKGKRGLMLLKIDM